MKISEFIGTDSFTLPKIQPDKKDFKEFIFELLDEFITKLKLRYDKNENFEECTFSIASIFNRQKHLVEQVKQALNCYYDGKPSKAYENLSFGLRSDLKDFSDVLNIRQFDFGSNFYRMRIVKENFALSKNQFFHIPYELRGIVKTQRFSIPGFPSLYIGNTLYVCWEELNRPNINEFQAVRLTTTDTIKILDLSPPKNTSLNDQDYYSYLMTWPLVLSSNVKVKNYDNTFKPEYIIPQLLLQWVRETQEIDGIGYRTTHIDFASTQSEGEFLNLVLPVKQNKLIGLCDSLLQKFEMTEATSVQLNQLSTGGMTILYNKKDNELLNEKIKKIELVKGKAFPYSASILGRLEGILNSMKSQPINQ